jgi:hypothetical protein
MAVPPDLRLCSYQDVIDVFGGDTATMNKMARGGTSTFDQTTLDKPILVASSDYETAAGNKFTLGYSADVTVYPMSVRNLVAIRAAWYFWLYFGRGQALPENLQKATDRADVEFAKLEDGKKGAGTQKAPASRVSSYQPADTTQGGTVPRMSLAAFRRL